MAITIWCEILKKLDKNFKAKGKKVLLIVDNAACHQLKDTVLENAKIEFPPPNTPSLIQPLDQGIIRSFKSEYRTCILRRQLLHLDSGQTLKDFSKKINLLEALKMIKRAWWMVSPTTIQNSFKKAGFVASSVSVDDEIVSEVSEETNLFSEAIRQEIDSLADLDSEIPCFGDMTDEDIVNEVLSGSTFEPVENSSDDEIVVVAPQKPTLKYAYDSLRILKQFFAGNLEASDKIDDLEDKMSFRNLQSRKQTTIDNFFS